MSLYSGSIYTNRNKRGLFVRVGCSRQVEEARESVLVWRPGMVCYLNLCLLRIDIVVQVDVAAFREAVVLRLRGRSREVVVDVGEAIGAMSTMARRMVSLSPDIQRRQQAFAWSCRHLHLVCIAVPVLYTLNGKLSSAYSSSKTAR